MYKAVPVFEDHERLKGQQNFALYCSLVKSHAQTHGLYGILDGSDLDPGFDDDYSGFEESQKWHERAVQAYYLVICNVDASIMDQYDHIHESDPKLLWDTLHEEYGSKS